MIRLLIFALLFFLGYTLFNFVVRALGPGRQRRPEKTRQGEEMVRDPHCGTFVPRGDALEANIAGGTHHFCSAQCRDAFRKKHRKG